MEKILMRELAELHLKMAENDLRRCEQAINDALESIRREADSVLAMKPEQRYTGFLEGQTNSLREAVAKRAAVADRVHMLKEILAGPEAAQPAPEQPAKIIGPKTASVLRKKAQRALDRQGEPTTVVVPEDCRHERTTIPASGLGAVCADCGETLA